MIRSILLLLLSLFPLPRFFSPWLRQYKSLARESLVYVPSYVCVCERLRCGCRRTHRPTAFSEWETEIWLAVSDSRSSDIWYGEGNMKNIATGRKKKLESTLSSESPPGIDSGNGGGSEEKPTNRRTNLASSSFSSTNIIKGGRSVDRLEWRRKKRRGHLSTSDFKPRLLRASLSKHFQRQPSLSRCTKLSH